MKPLKIVLFCMVLTSLFSCGTKGPKNFVDVHAMVSYGTKSGSGGACTGTGICGEVAIGEQAPVNAVKTKFEYDDQRPEELTITFSKSEIQKADKQHFDMLMEIIESQRSKDKKTYKFPKESYALKNALYRGLNLKETAEIVAEAEETLSLDGDNFILVVKIQP